MCTTTHCHRELSAIFYDVCFIEELSERLNSINKSSVVNQDENLKELEQCIKTHLKIQRLVRLTEKSFAKMAFFQGLTSSVILCTTAFSLSLVSYFFQFRLQMIYISPIVEPRFIFNWTRNFLHSTDGSSNFPTLLLWKRNNRSFAKAF